MWARLLEALVTEPDFDRQARQPSWRVVRDPGLHRASSRPRPCRRCPLSRTGSGNRPDSHERAIHAQDATNSSWRSASALCPICSGSPCWPALRRGSPSATGRDGWPVCSSSASASRHSGHWDSRPEPQASFVGGPTAHTIAPGELGRVEGLVGQTQQGAGLIATDRRRHARTPRRTGAAESRTPRRHNRPPDRQGCSVSVRQSATAHRGERISDTQARSASSSDGSMPTGGQGRAVHSGVGGSRRCAQWCRWRWRPARCPGRCEP